MQIILLSGGSGKRLWPLSNDIRSKQFIKIFKTAEGEYESMVQRVFSQIKTVDPEAKITIATSKSQVSAINNQLGDGTVGISVEPCRRDTFPAIALATAYLHDVMGVREDEPVVVCPVDPYVNNDYYQALKRLSDLAEEGVANLTLMGIEPTYPSEKYGYIIPENHGDEEKVLEMDELDSMEPLEALDKLKSPVLKVACFNEKPSKEVAKEYIRQGAMWNGGVFAYRLGYVLNRAHELLDFTDYQDLFNKYETLTKISFDYAVVEHETDIAVMRFSGQWKDLGTWNTLTEAMTDPTMGKVIMNDQCENVNVINELNVPILCMGLKNTIVAASPEGILVSDKEQSSYIKPYVDGIDQQIMFAEKSWGNYHVLDIERDSMTIKVTLNAGHQMNYHSHEQRDEVWTIVSGQGTAIVNGVSQKVRPGDVINLPRGTKHTILAESQLILIEVQMGQEISVHDKIKETGKA